MSAARTVQVELSERSYPIAIGSGLLSDCGTWLSSLRRSTHAVVIADENVEQSHALAVIGSLCGAGIEVDLLVVPAGEESKSVALAGQLWEKLLELGTDRKSLVVAVGGGVIGDLAGFVAASFARGLAFIQVPTTLLSQVDSSVGGKVGVNLPGAKNKVGAFWQPVGVLIDTATLDTLPEREYRAGLAEVVKYGVILDADFFSYLEAHVAELRARDPRVLQQTIARCCELKAQVVKADEREETGQRAVLNYGHTFCHAIEATAGYGVWLHGEAVAIGMLCASRLAERLGRIGPEVTGRQRELLAALDLPLAVPPLAADALVAAMSHDKKVEHGQLRFVLPSRMGHVELVGGVKESDVRAALAGG